MESGFQHSAFTFGLEAHVSQSNIDGSQVPTAALINLLQKGLYYVQAEISIEDDGTVNPDFEKLSLIDAVMPDVVASRQRKKTQPSTNEPLRKKKRGRKPAVSKQSATTETVGTADENVIIPESKAIVLQGHTKEVINCTWNPKSDLIASASADSTARIWDMSVDCSSPKTHMLLHFTERNGIRILESGDVTSVAWNSEGVLLATGSCDGYARIWMAGGSLISTLGRHAGPIFTLKWNRCSEYILTGGLDKTTRIWDVSTDECIHQYSFHTGAVIDVDWQTNRTFASCSTDKRIHICQLGHNEPLKSFQGHTGEVNIIKWNPQGTLLASCSDDDTLKIWSMANDKCVYDFCEHNDKITTIKWSPTGHGTSNPNMNLVLASASFDSTVKMWDMERGACVNTLKHPNALYSMAYSPDGKFLASGTGDSWVNIWSIQNSKLVHSYKGDGIIYDVEWNSSGNRLCATSSGGSVFVLDLRQL